MLQSVPPRLAPSTLPISMICVWMCPYQVITCHVGQAFESYGKWLIPSGHSCNSHYVGRRRNRPPPEFFAPFHEDGEAIHSSPCRIVRGGDWLRLHDDDRCRPLPFHRRRPPSMTTMWGASLYAVPPAASTASRCSPPPLTRRTFLASVVVGVVVVVSPSPSSPPPRRERQPRQGEGSPPPPSDDATSAVGAPAFNPSPPPGDGYVGQCSWSMCHLSKTLSPSQTLGWCTQYPLKSNFA